MRLDFFFDVVCPYAWLASRRLPALEARLGLRATWRPVLLGGMYKSLDAPQVPANTWSDARRRQDLRDLHRQAERLGLPLAFPVGHPRRTVAAMRLCALAAPEHVPRLAARLYDLYWVHGADVADPELLHGVAREHGLDPDGIDHPTTKERLRATTAAAVEAGAFGVPSFVAEREDGDSRLWFGGDRMPLMEAWLERRGRPPDPPAAAPCAGRKVRIFHDFSSPFSYLGATQVERVARQAGAEVEWVPILLGALFREIGTPDVPMFTYSAPKQRYLGRDLSDWAAWWGVPFRFPSTFPLRTVTALRVALIEPAATHALYRAAWADDLDIGQPAVVAAVLDAAGFPGNTLVARTADTEVKARLATNTAEAAQLDVPGVPTFQVVHRAHEPGLLFWGQDRADMVADALAGWLPADLR